MTALERRQICRSHRTGLLQDAGKVKFVEALIYTPQASLTETTPLVLILHKSLKADRRKGINICISMWIKFHKGNTIKKSKKKLHLPPIFAVRRIQNLLSYLL